MTATSSLLLLLLAVLPQDAPPTWDLEGERMPYKDFVHDATEGTWISVDVSPDGARIAFDLLGHIFEMPFDGGQARALTNGKSWNMFPRYSPDGKFIAFTSDRGGSNDIWTLERATGELKNVSDMDVPVFQATWSRDGQHLYATSLNMRVRFPVYQFNLFGEHEELIPGDGRAPVDHLWEHPIEAAIYFEHNDGSGPTSGVRIKRWDMQTGETSVFIDLPGGCASPLPSPDGEELAYVRRDDKQVKLVLRSFATETDRTLVTGLDTGRFGSRGFYGCYPNTAWTPDGKELLVSYGGKIQAIDRATGVARTIPFQARVERRIAETMRFRLELPVGGANTRSHRWSQPVEGGVLFESLGDLWVKSSTGTENLTKSDAHETSPVVDAQRQLIYYATWSDDELGALERRPLGGGRAERLTSTPSQYGSLELSPDGEQLAYVCGAAGIRSGTHLENQTAFELHVHSSLRPEFKVTDIEWLGNRYAKRPPSVRFSPDGEWLYFTEYADEELVLKRIRVDGTKEMLLYTFPHATRVVLSPDLSWMAFREYHRTFVTPFEFKGKALKRSAADKLGFCQRIPGAIDGDFNDWAHDSESLYWTRGAWFHRMTLENILAGSLEEEREVLSQKFELARPSGYVALQNARVITMNADKEVLEGATVLIDGDRIERVGTDIELPDSTKIFDLTGHTIIPGMFDAHGHYGSPISALNVIEQRHYGLLANLAYGVTTMYDVYGTTQKDFWIDDMLRAGKMTGPRIFSVGDPAFVTKYRKKMHRPIQSLADATDIAAFNSDHGATALKDYSNHRREARQQLVEACRKRELNLVTESFGNPQMNLTQLIDGFTGIEHTMGLTPLYEDVLSLFAATDVGMTPTLIVVYNGPAGERYFHMRERLWENEKLLHFFTKDELVRYRRPTHYFDDDFYHMEMAAELHKLYERGVLLQMGAHGQLMGLGAHWETEMFVHGGFTPHEALEIATINGFRHHGLDGDLGSIERGKLADLFIVSANPLEDIRNTRSIEFVMKNGFLYRGQDCAPVYPEAAPLGRMYFQQDQ